MLRQCALLAAMTYSLTAHSNAALPADEASQIAMDAYVYGYSLLTTEVTRVQMTNVAKTEGLRAPMGQFINVKRYPPAEFRAVSAPNADTLYSLAWLDLKEPQVFSHPDMGKRYYLFPLTNLWMIDFNTPGTRTTGEKAANYLITGPGWKGEVPSGMVHIPVATRYTVILGRTYADGSEADYQAVNALQAQYKITPLAAWGKPYSPAAAVIDPAPGFSMTDKPQKVILDIGVDGYFNKLAELMCEAAPPAAEDAPILARMAQIGLQPCKPFASNTLGADVQAALKDLPQAALTQIGANKARMGTLANGWIISKGLGVYSTDYMKRAVVAAFGWPANLQEDAVYPYTEVDGSGAKLNGANRYTLTFAKGQTPPVKAFWSITMYMIDQGWWFVPNPLNKFTVSPRDQLVYNADGSLTLYFQQESPGKDKEANWLPAPKGDFVTMMRMYWPQESNPSVLDGSWVPPKIVKAL